MMSFDADHVGRIEVLPMRLERDDRGRGCGRLIKEGTSLFFNCCLRSLLPARRISQR